jgi:hypothetical protein
VIRRGEVWIAPQGWVPPGRLIDPDTAEFGASWQDEDLLEDEVFRGAAAAVGWGRKRSDVVMIRLGHHEGSYFSAGERHPADAEGVPRWPPTPPAEGWWTPPPLPTLEEVQARIDRPERGETDQTEARAWAEAQLAIFGRDLDVPTLKALVDLSDGGERHRGDGRAS